jgi:biotin carboxylase
VNRADVYIPLHGELVDAFGVPGPGLTTVLQFKNKAKLHELMVKAGMARHRPVTELVALERLDRVLREKTLPVVVKPFMGSKSRSVFVVREITQLEEVMNRLVRHFAESQTVYHEEKQELALIEEYVEGRQVTAASFVDHKRRLTIVSYEDVLTGWDVGQRHQQLVYRTTPSAVGEGVRQTIRLILQRLVKESGLVSTVLHPEFLVTKDGGVYLIEVNVRLGGFRAEMLRLAYGMDMEVAALVLAMGDEVAVPQTHQGGCTAVEVWEDVSGRLLDMRVPVSDRVREYKQYLVTGEPYVAPPDGDKPLALYYVVGENSLGEAKDVRGRTVIELEASGTAPGIDRRGNLA